MLNFRETELISFAYVYFISRIGHEIGLLNFLIPQYVVKFCEEVSQNFGEHNMFNTLKSILNY